MAEHTAIQLLNDEEGLHCKLTSIDGHTLYTIPVKAIQLQIQIFKPGHF